MSKAQMGAGNVEIDLDGERVTLKPSLKAAQTTSRQAGGIIGAVDAVTKFDLDAITNIIALGLGKEPKEVADAVWRTGVANLAPSVVAFLTVLANGGRHPDATGGEGGADPQ